MRRLPGYAMPDEILGAARWYVDQVRAGNVDAIDRAEDLVAIAEELETVNWLTTGRACLS